jgi:PAS domain S-box-containing protein
MGASWLVRLAVTVVTVAVTLGLSVLVWRPAGAPSAVLVFGVMLATWWGGLSMGLLATALSALGSVVLVDEPHLTIRTLSSNELAYLATFCSVAVATSVVVDRQRRAQAALELLRLQRERLELAVRSTGIGLWYWDLPSNSLFWDERCRAHFGLSVDEDVSLPRFYDLLHPEDREGVRRAVDAALINHTVYDVDLRVLGADGVARWIRSLGRPFYDEENRPIRFDGATIDITRQKRTEHALSEANRLKDEFLATLSHELRTPLNAILGWAHMLARGELPPARIMQAGAVIERNAQAQARLVDDLLDLSSIMTGSLRLKPGPVDLAVVVSGALDAVRPAAEARRIDVSVVFEPDVRQVTGDPDRLRQVLWNLLTNAIKFTPELGHVTVEVTANGEWANIRVVDTGRGIDRRFLPFVFDRFRQADGSPTRAVGGLGLGLAIVRELVEAHGGSVSADSKGAGQGAVFTVTLPLLPQQRPPALLPS